MAARWNLTYGSYSQRNIAADYGLPFQAGGVAVRLHAYGEIDDSFSFYRGLHPSHQTLVLASDAFVGGWSFSADYMYYHSNGDVQTPGWNRLTQALIDNGTYITGRNTSLTDADHNGVLTLNELGGNPYNFDPNFQALYTVLPCTACSNAVHMLTSGVGTTHLDPRTVYIAKGVDFSNTVTHTGLVEVARTLGTGTLKLQGFVDTLENDRYVSYGYPASYRTLISEARLRYDDHADAFDGALTADAALGASYRYVDAIAKESFNSGVIALDRRDISQGPAANDVIASPFSGLPNALQWENNVHTNSSDAGLFAVGNLSWDKRLNLTVSGRYDTYDVRSVDMGVLSFEPAGRLRRQGRVHLFRQPVLQDRYRPGALCHQCQIFGGRDRPGGRSGNLAAGRQGLAVGGLSERGRRQISICSTIIWSARWTGITRPAPSWRKAPAPSP